MSTSDVGDDDDTPITLVLLIGRPDLITEWDQGFLTHGIERREFHRQNDPDNQVTTYPNPPYLNLQAAQQLLPSLTSYRILFIFVSLLELGHHQAVAILAGLTTLLETASEDRSILVHLEYEQDNPEHGDVRQLVEAYGHHLYVSTWIHSNIRLEAVNPRLLDEGDNGQEMEDEDIEDRR